MSTTTITTMLCASTRTLRTSVCNACRNSGMRTERIMPSAWVKAVQPSPTRELRERPQHLRQREERQVLVHVGVEQHRVEHAKRRDHDRGGQCEPERPKHRAAVAQADIQPAERCGPAATAATHRRRPRAARRLRAVIDISPWSSRTLARAIGSCATELMRAGAIADPGPLAKGRRPVRFDVSRGSLHGSRQVRISWLITTRSPARRPAALACTTETWRHRPCAR